MIPRSTVLQVVRRCTEALPIAEDDDTRLLLRAGVFPKALLYQAVGANTKVEKAEVDKWLEELIISRRIIQSRSYLRAEPKDRVRPVHSNYDIEKPTTLPPRSQIHPTLHRRDRLALWYAAANHDLSGSQGDTTAIYLLLEFWRLPNIHRRWRKWIGTRKVAPFRGKLPEDAQ